MSESRRRTVPRWAYFTLAFLSGGLLGFALAALWLGEQAYAMALLAGSILTTLILTRCDIRRR